MKKLILSSVLFCFYFVANAQIIKKDAATKITESKRVSATEIAIKSIDSTAIFILDGKICNYKSFEFEKIDINNLRLVKEIKDPSSKTDIKSIYFFERKIN